VCAVSPARARAGFLYGADTSPYRLDPSAPFLEDVVTDKELDDIIGGTAVGAILTVALFFIVNGIADWIAG